jgi:hypothetical protein
MQVGQLKHVFLFLKMFANIISLREFGSPMSIVSFINLMIQFICKFYFFNNYFFYFLE